MKTNIADDPSPPQVADEDDSLSYARAITLPPGAQLDRFISRSVLYTRSRIVPPFSTNTDAAFRLAELISRQGWVLFLEVKRDCFAEFRHDSWERLDISVNRPTIAHAITLAAVYAGSMRKTIGGSRFSKWHRVLWALDQADRPWHIRSREFLLLGVRTYIISHQADFRRDPPIFRLASDADLRPRRKREG